MDEFKIAVIDHCADRVFELALDCSCAITVGDDTTSIAADILSRFGIPIIGVTDGDTDGFSHQMHVCPGSLIFQVEDGYDDVIGKKIMAELNMVNFDVRAERISSFSRLKELVREMIGERFVSMKSY